MKELVHDYHPRDFFLPFHQRRQRWSIIVAHRRCGKTVATINDIIGKAAYSMKPRPRYAYLAPFYSQAKQIAWDMLKHYSRGLQPKIMESSLSVEFPHNESRITLYGADNPDSLRGIYLDGVVPDEYGLMKPSIFTEVIRPTLADRKGWATFIGTPNGPNHFYDTWEIALKNPDNWFTLSLPYETTQILSDEEIQDLRAIMTEEEFEQEMRCNFFAAMRGAFYGKEIETAETEGRIRLAPRDPRHPVHYVFDLGYTDSTAIWGWQELPGEIRVVFCYSAESRPISHYIQLLHDLPGKKGNIWLPHDARAKTLQTGRSIVEQFVSGGIRPKLVPNLDIMDGIHAARLMFKYLVFDTSVEAGLKALKVYHREWDGEKRCFRDRPVHDWSSHYADAFRYLALVAKPLKIEQVELPTGKSERSVAALGQFSLEQLYNDRDSAERARR